jgi:hypothetical protein
MVNGNQFHSCVYVCACVCAREQINVFMKHEKVALLNVYSVLCVIVAVSHFCANGKMVEAI